VKDKAPLKLYQFAISHYCEKARWALDYKGLDYQIINLLPGLHFSKTKKFSPNSNLPILVHGDKTIQGSSQIIDYLDLHFTDKSLTPVKEADAVQAKEWEKFADENIGPHIRRILYHTLLAHPEIVIPFFSHHGPWYSKFYFKVGFKKLVRVMRKFMSINDENVRISEQILSNAIEKIGLHLGQQTSSFMVGDQFSRADLAIAALLAPLIRPIQYDLPWPNTYPDEIDVLTQKYQGKLDHIERYYCEFR